MSENPSTVEQQYNMLYEVEAKHGRTKFGLMANESWNNDPKRTVFTLSRYKFVAKMLEGLEKVLEVGCADAFATRIVQQSVGSVTVTDFDPVFIDDVKSRVDPHWPLEAHQHNWVDGGPMPKRYNAAFAMDVLEHIHPSDEAAFIGNIKASLAKDGICIFGMPSSESQTYASPQSKAGHVNCKSGSEFKGLMRDHFETVFVFSMNDELVHTGFYPMAQYLIAVGSHPRVD